MSISIVSHNHFAGTDNVNAFSASVTAVAGDVIEVTLQYWDQGGATFSPVWNGHSFTEMAPRVQAAGFFKHRFWLKVATGGTANLTGGTSPTYTILNYSYKVLRSSINAFAAAPLKSFTGIKYTSGTYVNPSIANNLTSSDFVVDSLCTPNWDISFAGGSTTFSPDSPSALIGSCTSAVVANVKRMYSSYRTGSGSATSSYTKSGSQSPMYQFSTAVFYEAAQLITSINGGNPITAGQTGIAIVASGFTAKPTGVTATYAAGAKSISATVDSGGTATNFNISIQDRIEAEDWPVNGDTLTFTFTYLSESATGTQTLVKKATETVLTVSGGITSDPATWKYWLTQDGFTVEGGELAYIPYGDLVLTADGGGSATNAGTFTSWFRPATGTGAGNVYAYTWVVTEAGISLLTGVSNSHYVGLGLGIGF